MIDAYLRKTGESQNAFAARLGVSTSFLSLLVNGKRQPSLGLAFRIQRLTGGEVPASSWVLDEEGGSVASGDAA